MCFACRLQNGAVSVNKPCFHLTRHVLVQTPKLRLHAHRLTDRTCLAVRLGLLNNLESLRISRMRDENDVQVRTHDDQSHYSNLCASQQSLHARSHL